MLENWRFDLGGLELQLARHLGNRVAPGVDAADGEAVFAEGFGGVHRGTRIAHRLFGAKGNGVGAHIIVAVVAVAARLDGKAQGLARPGAGHQHAHGVEVGLQAHCRGSAMACRRRLAEKLDGCLHQRAGVGRGIDTHALAEQGLRLAQTIGLVGIGAGSVIHAGVAPCVSKQRHIPRRHLKPVPIERHFAHKRVVKQV